MGEWMKLNNGIIDPKLTKRQAGKYWGSFVQMLKSCCDKNELLLLIGVYLG